MRRKSTRLRQAQSLVEVVAGLCVLLPIALGLIDFTAVIACKMANDSLARNVARVAAEQPYPNAGAGIETYMESMRSRYGPGQMFELAAITMDQAMYANKVVHINSSMLVHLPVPMPGVPDNTVTLNSVSKQPVVTTIAEPPS